MTEIPIPGKHKKILAQRAGRNALGAMRDAIRIAGWKASGLGVPESTMNAIRERHELRAVAKSLRDSDSGRTARREWNKSLLENYGFTRRIFGK